MTNLVQDAYAPDRTSRAVVLVVGDVLGEHQWIDVVGSVDALYETHRVALLVLLPVVEDVPLHILSPVETHSENLPDVAVLGQAGWTVAFIRVQGCLDCPPCHPFNMLRWNVPDKLSHSCLKGFHLWRDLESHGVLDKVVDVRESVYVDSLWSHR